MIVGGGPAGLAAAISLADAQINAIVIEKSDYNSLRLGEHLTPDGIPALQQLGLWDQQFIEKHRLCYGIRSAWGEDKITQSDYIFHPCGYGINLSRPAFDKALVTHARDKGVKLLEKSNMRSVQRQQNEWVFSLDTPTGCRTLRAKFVVDASGRAAVFARRQGRKSLYRDRLIGFAAFTSRIDGNRKEQQETLFLESSQFGWWYFAQLKDNKGVFLFVTDADQLYHIKDSPLRIWQQQLNLTHFIRELILAYNPVKNVIVRSVQSHCLDNATGRNWLAVGDAATSFDPLSSMGISKGLKGGISSSRVILRYLNTDMTALTQYRKEIELEFEKYMERHTAYYQLEKRWLSSPFWIKRQKNFFSDLQRIN